MKKNIMRLIGLTIIICQLLQVYMPIFTYAKELKISSDVIVNEKTNSTNENVQDEEIDEIEEISYETKRIIVVSESEFDKYGATSVEKYDDIYILSYNSEDDCKNAYVALKQNETIISVEIDSIMETDIIYEQSKEKTHQREDIRVQSKLKKYLDNLESINEVTVAIIDTGINVEDEMFDKKIIDLGINYSSSGDENSIYDDNGHGTNMAKIIIENSNKNVKLMPIKVANSEGKATVLNTYLGIKTAIENNADVINISMGTISSSKSKILTDIINEAINKNIIVVISAGNDSSNSQYYTPSNIENAIVISATDENGAIQKFSNYGNTIDYSAVGENGSSEAAAFVSAIVAQIKSQNKDINTKQVQNILKNNVKDLGYKGYDKYYGYGWLSLYELTDNSIRELFNRLNLEKDTEFEKNILEMGDFHKLSDKKINEYLSNSEPYQIGQYLTNLSKEDYNELLSRDTILSEKNTFYFGEGTNKNENINIDTEKEMYFYELCLSDYEDYSETLSTNERIW